VYNPVTYTAPTFYAYNSSNTFLGVPDANPTPLFAGSFNPFTDTLTNAPNLAPFRSGNYNTGKTTSNDLVLAASGPLMHLSWGEPRLSIRLEHNKSGQPGGSVSAITIAGTPYLGLPITPYTQTSFGQTQTTDNANAEFDVPIFKTKLPFLRSLDVQFDFGSVRRTTWVGTAGTTTYIPYAYSLYPNGGTLLVGPDSLSPNGGDFITPVTQQDGTISPASTAQPIRLKTVSSNTSLTGPAFSYKPIDDIIIRGSIANGYVPPSYDQLIPNVAPVTPAPYYGPISDPKNPSAGQYYITEIDEGNPNLRPQTSKSWDLGVVWEPQSGFLKGLRLDAEFSETKQFNLILQPGIQFFVSNESLYPNLVVRDQASGLVSTVYNQWINVAEAKQDAWTFTLDYPWRTAIGSFELTASETIQEHNSQQIAPGTLPLEYVGFPNSGGVAKTKATGSLRWSWRNWVAAWTTVYYGAYKQVGAPGDPEAYASALETNTPYTISTFYLLPQGGDTIPGQIYHNLYLSYTFRKETLNPTSRIGRWADAFMDGIKVSFGVNNVFNTLPAFDAYYAPFYASPFGDTKLRNYQFQIRKSF
jgi:outer membrane receptor protein involved in Fe transport